MKKILILFLLIGISAWAQNQREVEFIQKNALLAVQEMELYKVPASITLAQGILESASGTSELAVNAKNHFGIKCKGKEWSGETYYKSSKEDTGTRIYDETSCFRKYNSIEESFRDHSKFIAERPYYTKCFKSNVVGYKDFAHCLKKSGYATDRNYASNLINIIENYGLYAFDDVQRAQVYDQVVALYGPVNRGLVEPAYTDETVVAVVDLPENEIDEVEVEMPKVEPSEPVVLEVYESKGEVQVDDVIAAVEFPNQEGITFDEVFEEPVKEEPKIVVEETIVAKVEEPIAEEPKVKAKEMIIAKTEMPKSKEVEPVIHTKVDKVNDRPKEIAAVSPVKKQEIVQPKPVRKEVVKVPKPIKKEAPKTVVVQPKKRTFPKRRVSPRARLQIHPIRRQYIVVKQGETLYEIAKTYKTTVDHLMKCNELEKAEDLRAYQYLFFAKKKSKGAMQFITAQKGDNLYTIAQKGGIKFKQLLKRNRIDENYKPKQGEKFYLKGKKPRK